MTKRGKIIVTVGLLSYGVASLIAIVITLFGTATFRGVYLIMVSLPWSLVVDWALSALFPNALERPSGAWMWIGVGLTGIALNCVLFWLFVKLTVGRAPKVEQRATADPVHE